MLRLVRHGETDWTADKRYCGTTDIALNETGRRQADGLGWIAAERHDSVWTSPLARCRETAERIGLEARLTTALAEFDFGELEGSRWDDLDAATRDALVEFDGFVAPGGESVRAFGERIDDFVAGLGPGRHLLVTHGGVIRHLLRRAGRDEHVAPGGVLEIDLDG
ncbi:MAG: histidine phosphatase family protein [Actinomycetota bacterium]